VCNLFDRKVMISYSVIQNILLLDNITSKKHNFWAINIILIALN